MTDKSRSTPEADLAFLRSIVQGGNNPKAALTLGVAYLAGGLLYGLQCLFHIGQVWGVIRWPDLANLAFVVAITVAFFIVLMWAVREDRKAGTAGPIVTRTLNAAFSGAGMANLAIVIVFGFGARRDQDFAVWLYYPSMIFALQSAAWFVAWNLKKKGWMLATSLGGWATAVALGLLVRESVTYLYVCTAALFLLFAGPGWIMTRDALRKRQIEADVA
ncbi:MAG: hypothetical protein DI552_08230 [Brevundimonas sp.]|uniref:DUF2157 domain-containing protein n=1 Tax=Brevundimonas albigilva TaxID=1312364 RepID=A0ABY4SIX6_9CAUL|nr:MULTISPECIES: hypothetical protein [Brevundimonas]MCV0415201.1 hypothetical protein [Brevundimonas sp.]PZU57293.1 MAG: hypothetical protein DI552_08230 [Brevundimonas sp.]UQV17238.1 hypothetical protein MU852_09760 [Brevundimonas albigilva]URI14936.1 hypothetical protein M8231_14180 [Brevundimonas albigilva]